MPITASDIAVLLALVRYYVLTRPQIQRLCFPAHRSGRSVRRRLSRLFHARLIGKHSLAVAFPSAAAAGPAYYLTSKGAELLATYFDDEAYFKVNTRCPRADLLAHWIAISEAHMVVEQAIAAQSDVKLQRWINEWETVNKDASK